MPRSGPHWTEEIWTSAVGPLMVGASRSQRGFGFQSFSHMRVEESEDGVVILHLSNSNGAVGAYRMTRSGNREDIFDDPEAGARIFYQRVGDTLTVSYSRNGGSPEWTRRYVRVPAAPE